jgi:hypothetical protein
MVLKRKELVSRKENWLKFHLIAALTIAAMNKPDKPGMFPAISII